MRKLLILIALLLSPVAFGAGDVRQFEIGPPFGMELQSGNILWFTPVRAKGELVDCGPTEKGGRLQCGTLEFRIEYELSKGEQDDEQPTHATKTNMRADGIHQAVR